MTRFRYHEHHAANVAAAALGLGLAGMTWERWSVMSDHEREKLRDLSDLTPQLKGYEGCRVEVITTYGERRRFWVSRSTGWRPCHIERKHRDSSGGIAADKSYQSVLIVSHREPTIRR